MGAMIRFAHEHLGHDFTVYWVNNGAPESFSLPQLDPAAIMFSQRYLQLATTMRTCLTNLIPKISDNIALDIGYRFSLRVMAEISLHHGHISKACYLFARSISGERAYVQPDTLAHMETMPHNEMYMVLWFYAMLHEIGHVHTLKANPSQLLSNVSDNYIEKTIRAYFEHSKHPGDIEQFVRLSRQTEGLGPEVLRTEANADLFAVNVLLLATPLLMERYGGTHPFNPADCAVEILRMLQACYYMNSCQVGGITGDYNDGAVRDHYVLNIANTIRVNLIADYIALLLSRGEASDAFSKARSDLLAALELGSDGHDRFDLGNARAMDEATSVSNRTTGAMWLLAEYLDDDPGFWVFTEAEHFISTAHRIGIQHADLALLENLIAQQGHAREFARKMERRYLLGWHVKNDEGFPFGVHTRHGYTIFVFLDPALFYSFASRAGDDIWPEFSLQKAEIVALSEQDALVTVDKKMPSDFPYRTQTFIQGSTDFEVALDELEDGSIFTEH